jgi:hypothetical protein
MHNLLGLFRSDRFERGLRLHRSNLTSERTSEWRQHQNRFRPPEGV